MEVMPGYKTTEIGVFPDEWQISKLGSHVTFKTGPFGSALHKSDYVEGGIPVINPMQIGNGKIVPTQTMTITEQAAQHLSEFRLVAGNIVIGRRGEMGRCAFVGATEHGWLCGTGSMVIRTASSVEGRYLQRVLSSPAIIAEIENTSVGTTMINLNQGTLGNLVVPLPPMREQRAIADILDDMDAYIDSLEQLTVKKINVKQGAMLALITGKSRLPEFSAGGVACKQSEAGVIPMDWSSEPLTKLGTWKGGGTPSMQNSALWLNGTVPWLSSGDVKEALLSDAPMKITEAAIKASSTTLLPANSIIIVTRSGILRKYLPVAKNTRPLAINQDLKALIPASNVVPDYLLHLLLGFGPQILAKCLKSGTTVESVEFRWLKAFHVPMPPTKAEQKAIASILSDLDAEITVLEAKLGKARQLKLGMMHELLTGRIRLT